MPDVSLNGIEFEIKGSTDAASSSIDNLIGKLSALNTALSDVANIKKLATGLNSLKKAIDNLNSADLDKIKASLESFGQVSESLSALSSMSKDLASFMRALSKLAESPENVLDLAQALNILGSVDLTNLKDAEGALRALADSLSAAGKKNTAAKAVRDVGREAKKANTPLKNFLASIKRIAFYRILRGILKSVSQGFQEGLKNAYQFSKLNGGELAKSLDLVATKSLTMKNQLGAAFGALLNAIAPVVVAIISLITRLANALSMLFSAIGGGTQYKKAKDAWTDWGDAAAGAGGAAKEAMRYLAPFDELNRLPDDNGGGGGGGSAIDPDDMFEYKDLPEWLQNFADKLQELAASLKITFNDVFFDWSDLTGEQIAEKAITGLSALLGAGVGFLIGGVPGAVVGTLVGTTVGLMVSSLIFDHDGTISQSEIANMVSLGLSALCGGVLGFVAGGPAGTLIGATVGIGIWGALKELEFFSDGKVGDLTSQLATALTTLTGAVIGFTVGGPGGALIGAAIGLGLSMTIGAITFDGDAHPGYRSGLDWFVIEVLGLPSDEELKSWGSKALQWVIDGINDTVDEISIAFTGMDWESMNQWLEDGGERLKAWLSDNFVRGFAQAAIDARNSLVAPIQGAINSIIEQYNNIAEKLGLPKLDPIDIKLIPDLDPPVGTLYDQTKNKWENESQNNPVDITVGKFTGTNGGVGNGLDLPPIEVPGKVKFNSYEKDADGAVAGIGKVWAYGKVWFNSVDRQSNGALGGIGKVWSYGKVWFNSADKQSNGAIAGIGPVWSYGKAWFNKYQFTSGIETNGVNTKIHVTGQTNTPTIDANLKFKGNGGRASGGAFYGGVWHDIPQYASGGRPHGTMFVAGEAGPEIVGHVGGRTEVLNQSQLAATMYAAVRSALSGLTMVVSAPSASASGFDGGADEETMYRAFSRALADSDLGGDIELDGEAIYRSVVRRNRQNTRATGVNQFAMA